MRTWIKTEDLTNDPFIDDYYLLRFLRARKFDMEKTQFMFKNYLQWRKDNGVDDIKSFDFTEAKEVFPHYQRGYHKTDKLGRPIYYERVGQMKVNEVWKITNEERMVKGFIQAYEHLVRCQLPGCSLAKGSKVEQTFTIIDLKGFSLSMMTSKTYGLIKIASSVAQDNYPEVMGATWVINSGMLFTGVWSIVKGFLDEKTQKKI